jgi:hypothetical protein
LLLAFANALKLAQLMNASYKDPPSNSKNMFLPKFFFQKSRNKKKTVSVQYIEDPSPLLSLDVVSVWR